MDFRAWPLILLRESRELFVVWKCGALRRNPVSYRPAFRPLFSALSSSPATSRVWVSSRIDHPRVCSPCAVAGHATLLPDFPWITKANRSICCKSGCLSAQQSTRVGSLKLPSATLLPPPQVKPAGCWHLKGVRKRDVPLATAVRLGVERPGEHYILDRGQFPRTEMFLISECSVEPWEKVKKR